MKDQFLAQYQIIGDNVRQLRKERGWSQVELASRCSTNAEQISRIENARRSYMIDTLFEVCDALGVSLNDVIHARR